MDWNIPNIWGGGDCWIIGGGPSVAIQFNIPQDVVNKVALGELTPSAFSPYMLAIHNKHVIGVNAAYLLGDWIDIVFFGDIGFFLPNQEQLKEHTSLKVTCVPLTTPNWVKKVPQDKEYIWGITTNKNKVSWNGNSGAAAINLAVHLGAIRIFLLGFDMTLGEGDVQHWHNVYQSNTQKRKKHKLPFEAHLQGFPKIAADAKKLGVEIINVNPNSMIPHFPKVSLKQIL
jgi:hypothetical protein